MAAAYKVLKIDELVRMGDMGGVEPYDRHTIKTKGGVTLRVDVDAADFTAEKVAPILLARAQEADKILAL